MSMIIYTLDEHGPTHPSFDEFGPHCVRGSWGVQLHKDLHIAKGARYAHKGHRHDTPGFDAFEDEDLLELLHDHQIQDLVIMGVALEYCIRATVLGALDNKLNPIIILDGCFAADQTRVYPVLNELMSKGAYVMNSGDIPPAPFCLPHNTAFMVVDVQNDFFYGNDGDSALPIAGADQIIPRINEVLENHEG